MRSMILLGVMFMISMAKSFNFECDFERSSHCEVKNFNIQSPNEEITSVNGKTTPTDIFALEISDQMAQFLPKNFDKFFPKLRRLYIQGTPLKQMSKNVLNGFPLLERFFLHSSEVEKLDGDLFKNNPLLHYINISRNEKLNVIGPEILNGVNDDYEQISFAANGCISTYTPKDDLRTLKQKLQDQCQSSEKSVELKGQIVALNDKNVALNDRNIALKDEVAMLKEQLAELQGMNVAIKSKLNNFVLNL